MAYDDACSVKRQKLLYIMGIDWEWIYQRPQILAEKFAEDYDVTVVFPRSVLECLKKKPDKAKMTMRILWTLPFQEKLSFIGMVAKVFHGNLFKDIHSFDKIYIGYPLYQRYIPADYTGQIIYDCMDNFEALYPDQKRKHRIIRQEEELIRRCDVLVASAQFLVTKVNSVVGWAKARLVRNGISMPHVMPVKESQIKSDYHVGYIGTIAEWFDTELLRYGNEHFPNVHYHLIGPGTISPAIERTKLYGAVPHYKLKDYAENLDCLIMPFLINDIVTAVDPVKLYEYIAFGKCIISVYYDEIARFEDFVYFYRSYEEFESLLNSLICTGFPPKYNANQQAEFLSNNEWNLRYEQLKMIMIQCEESK